MMNIATKPLRRDLALSKADCFFFSVMVGAGETFLPAFVLALGSSDVVSGLVAAVPYLTAAIFQLTAPGFVRKVGSYRRYLTWLAVLQGLCFVPLALGALSGSTWPAVTWPALGPQMVVFVFVTLYWTCGLASGPAWNAWMCSLVPQTVRSGYFAERNRLGQVGLLLGLVFAGVLLDFARRSGNGRDLFAFGFIFAVATIFRLASAWCLSRQSEPVGLTATQTGVRLRSIFARMRGSRDGQLILFLAVFQIAVNISSPFFNPFLLKQLSIPYVGYMVLTAALIFSKMIVFSRLGSWGKRIGHFRLMTIGAFGIATVPLLWSVSSSYVWLLAAQLFSGGVWALFELGALLALFQAIRNEERIAFMALYNFINAIGVLAGTMLGALILRWLGETYRTYLIVFSFSVGARFLCAVVMDRLVLRDSLVRLRTMLLHLPKDRRQAEEEESRGRSAAS